MRSPDEIQHDEQAGEYLRAVAALAGDFYSALRSSGIPEAAAVQMLVDWHADVLDDGVVWESDED